MSVELVRHVRVQSSVIGLAAIVTGIAVGVVAVEVGAAIRWGARRLAARRTPADGMDAYLSDAAEIWDLSQRSAEQQHRRNE